MKLIRYLVIVAVLFVLGLVGFAYLAPGVAVNAVMTAERTAAGLERKSITLEGGEHIVYLEGGQGEPLMLIHGFTANKDNFTRVAKHLTSRYHVIIPDLVGFGESERPPMGDYSVSAQAERLHRLAAALGLKDGLHIGGSSMGGHISMTWASLYPQEVKSMWLLDPGGVWSAPVTPMMKTYLDTGKMTLVADSEEEFLALPPLVMSKPPFVPTVLLREMAHENLPYKDLMYRILGQLSKDPIEPRLQGMTTPALLVWGDQDQVLSVESVPVLQKLLPQAKVIIMPGIGHLPMLEDVDQSAKDYLAFRDQLKS